MRVEIRDIGDVATFRFHPIGQRKFPEKPFAGTDAQRRVENLTVFAVRPIETDGDIAAPIPLAFAVIIKRKLVRPTVVGLPSGIRALEKIIRPTRIANDENNITLP